MSKKTTEAPSKLTMFEGKPVHRATVKITGAGDGLSQAMAIEPAEYHHGEKLMVLMEVDVAKVSYDPISAKTPDVLERVHFFKAGVATVIDTAEAKAALEAQRVALEKASGTARLDLDQGATEDDAFE